jgi:hypothetical protein
MVPAQTTGTLGYCAIAQKPLRLPTLIQPQLRVSYKAPYHLHTKQVHAPWHLRYSNAVNLGQYPSETGGYIPSAIRTMTPSDTQACRAGCRPPPKIFRQGSLANRPTMPAASMSPSCHQTSGSPDNDSCRSTIANCPSLRLGRFDLYSSGRPHRLLRRRRDRTSTCGSNPED